MRKAFTLIELMIVIAIIAIIAAIAIPNLLESRVTANEGAASATLKSGIFPAEVQWKAGAYQDYNSNNVGEYGTLAYLAGKNPVATPPTSGAQNIALLTGPLAVQAMTALTVRNANGYQYIAAVPNIAGGPAMVWEGTALPAIAVQNKNDCERYFIVGCAPEKYSDTGRRVFSIMQDGQVRSPAGSNAIAKNAVWMGAAVVNNPVPTFGSIQLGLATCFSGGVVDFTTTGVTFLTADYPVYTK